jgi:hypothetical protein
MWIVINKIKELVERVREWFNFGFPEEEAEDT